VGGGGSLGIAADPSVPGKIIAGINYTYDQPFELSWPGAIFISYDYGATFQAVEADIPRGAMEVFNFAPSDPAVVYAAGYGGILRSANGGLNWTDITPAGLPRGQFTNLAVHPTDPNTILTSIHGTGETGGVFRSTNGGQSWQRIAPYSGWALIYTTGAPPVLYLGGMDGLWSSRDDGLTWTRAAGDLASANMTRLAFARDEGRSVLYVGTAGGVPPADAPGADTLSPSAAASAGANAGLYRMAEAALEHVISLPMVRR